MKTVNEAWFACRPDGAFALAEAVEHWPDWLPHYRWVRASDAPNDPQQRFVEMAARRDFGRIGWPVWWASRMNLDPDALSIRYTHLAGITKGMEVEWRFVPAYSGTRVKLVHWWHDGPRAFGPASRLVARHIVGPLFVQFIADQTLHHLAQRARRERIG